MVIPARNEERTVAGVVSAIAQLAAETGLVDELVVMDSDSTDGTSRVAAEAGAAVFRAREVAPELGAFPGKGEALWKSLLVTKGDLLVFVDADLTEWGPHFVTGLLGPLLQDAGVLLVKGYYERLYQGDDGSVSGDGGRVTELVARPLLSLWWPELGGGGAAAGRRVGGTPRADGVAAHPGRLRHRARGAARYRQGARAGRGRPGRPGQARAHRHQASHDLAVMAAELMLVGGPPPDGAPPRTGRRRGRAAAVRPGRWRVAAPRSCRCRRTSARRSGP